MANLLWKRGKKTKALLAKSFATEDEFETFISETKELLQDVIQLKRQVRGGGKSGIADIVGVDSDGSVCIIEMKNTAVDASIIPQVLEYAFWAQNNPDSIKTLWLERGDKTDDIEIPWDNLQVRIIIIAPEIRRSTLDIVSKIAYPVDLIEIKRWTEGNDHFLLVNKIEEEPEKARSSPVSGKATYDEAFYRSQYNNRSVTDFLHYASELQKFVGKRNWPLQIKFNKHYCGFKAGFFNAFGIKWIGTKSFAFFFKLSQADAKSTKIPISRYEEQWGNAVYKIKPGKTKLATFVPLLELAYKRRAGE